MIIQQIMCQTTLADNDCDDEQVQISFSNTDFKWEDMSNYRWQKELFNGGFGLYSTATNITDSLEIF
jgi:hypothetical protein